jgi:hypothetical protein
MPLSETTPDPDLLSCLRCYTAGSWDVLDTLGDVIICNHLSATRKFCHVPEPSMGFHEVLQDSVGFHGFYEVPWDSIVKG